MGKFIDLTGQKFGKLVFIRKTPYYKSGHVLWECLCDCGNTKNVRGNDIRSGKIQSCGCLKKQMVIDKNTSHGLSETREYEIWAGIKKRCYNPKFKQYKNYGGRGIKVCDKWHGFKGFWEDMQEGYSDNLTIDRINNNGDYEKSNCRWATMKQQMNNKRNNRLIKFNNTILTMTEWEEKLHLTPKTLNNRITTHSWSIEKALTTPI